MEDSGEYRVESTEWRVESGEWRVESGEDCSSIQLFNYSTILLLNCSTDN